MDDSEIVKNWRLLRKIFQEKVVPWENVPENIRAYGLVTPNEEMGYAAMKIHEYVSVKIIATEILQWWPVI